MPKRSDISSIFAIGAALTLAACDGIGSSRSETTTVSGGEPATVSECLEKFSKNKGLWSDKSIRSSFVYDVTEMDLLEVRKFWKVGPEDGGAHHGSIHQGGGTEAAIAKFLASEPKGDSEMFGAEEIILLRVNDGPQQSFDDALRTGCGRVREGVTVRQASFSQGSI